MVRPLVGHTERENVQLEVLRETGCEQYYSVWLGRARSQRCTAGRKRRRCRRKTEEAAEEKMIRNVLPRGNFLCGLWNDFMLS